MQGRVNIPIRGGGGGEGASLNIFAQSTEPTTKDGIWIDTSATGNLPAISKFEYEGIEISNIDYHNSSRLNEFYVRQSKDIPYSHAGGNAINIDNDIFIFGSSSSTYYRYAYKINVNTHISTRLTNIPYNFSHGSIAKVGRYIYLFGGSAGKTRAYKYDIDLDTYTMLTNIPYNHEYGFAVTVGTNIYLFGGNSAGYFTAAYKYDTLTDTYTKLTDVPYSMQLGCGTAYGTKIYLFNNVYAYEYNILTNEYVALANIPESMTNSYPSCIMVNTDIIIIGSKKAYLYDIDNGMWSEFSVYSYGTVGEGNKILNINDDIYFIPAYLNLLFKIMFAQLKSNYVYLFSISYQYDINLLDNVIIPILHAYICQNGELKKYPAYYGDGTQWLPLAS